MAIETIFQNEILTKFVYPFLLIFFIVFAVLEKSKILGEGKQINAIVSFVIGLIFVGAVFPKVVLGNLVLFLSLALVIVFVVMLLWGFVASDKDKGLELSDGLKKGLMVVIGIAVVVASLWALGVGQSFWDWLFRSSWSDTFWTNFLFLVVIAAALAAVLRSGK